MIAGGRGVGRRRRVQTWGSAALPLLVGFLGLPGGFRPAVGIARVAI